MPKRTFEYIEEMTDEFQKLTFNKLMDTGLWRWWLLRLLLAIAQQVAVISGRLGES